MLSFYDANNPKCVNLKYIHIYYQVFIVRVELKKSGNTWGIQFFRENEF